MILRKCRKLTLAILAVPSLAAAQTSADTAGETAIELEETTDSGSAVELEGTTESTSVVETEAATSPADGTPAGDAEGTPAATAEREDADDGTLVATAPREDADDRAPATETAEEDEETGRGHVSIRRRPRPDPLSYRSSQYAAVELRFGPYEPRVDDEFPNARPYETVFGDKTRFQAGFELDYQALRIPYLGSLGPGLGISYTRASAKAPLTDGSGLSAQDTTLWVLPLYAVAVLRVDVLARKLRIPVVPYAKAGLAYAFWSSNEGDEVARDDDGVIGRGAETGYLFALGGMFLLDVLHPQAALDMDNSTGINHAYVFGEWFLSDVDSFGSGMQVGTNTWVAGLALEF